LVRHRIGSLPEHEVGYLTAFVRLVAAFSLVAGLAGSANAAEKHPPACAAIAFQPVPSGLTDGEQEAGFYKSHIGRIELRATVKDGVAQNYFVEFGGKPLSPTPDALPPSVAACAKLKRLTAPTGPATPCTGDRFTVLIDHTGEHRYVLLYGHSGSAWHFCSAGIA
jgi:hypothetical protein